MSNKSLSWDQLEELANMHDLSPSAREQTAEEKLHIFLEKIEIARQPRDLDSCNFAKKVIRFRNQLGSISEYDIKAEYSGELHTKVVAFLKSYGLDELAKKISENYEGAKRAENSKEPSMSDVKNDNKPNQKTRTIKSRISDAFSEGIKRAPVELALEEGQQILVNEILRGYKGTKAEKQAARKFMLWFFASPAGQVAIAGAISAGAPLVAGLLGKDGPVVQTVADEFAARAATITTKEGMRFAARQLKPLLSVFTKLFDSVEKIAEIPALNEPSIGCSIFDMESERAKVSAR